MTGLALLKGFDVALVILGIAPSLMAKLSLVRRQFEAIGDGELTDEEVKKMLANTVDSIEDRSGRIQDA